MCKSTILVLMRQTNFQNFDIETRRNKRNSILNLTDEHVIIFVDNPKEEIPKRRKNSIIGIIYVDPPTEREDIIFREKFPKAIISPFEEFKEKTKELLLVN